MPVCDLECGAGVAHEFTGPVRIVVVEDDTHYIKILKAGLLMSVYVFMGIVLLPPVIYYLDFTIQAYDILHVLLGTSVCQCFIPLGVLFHNNLAMITAHLRPVHRRKEHLIVQSVSCFYLLATFGVSWKIYPHRDENVVHKYAGYILVILSIVNNLVGALVHYWDWDSFGTKIKPFFVRWHRIFGISTTFFCFVTYISGISTQRFLERVPPKVRPKFPHFLGAITFLYTAIILYFPFMKFFEVKETGPSRI